MKLLWPDNQTVPTTDHVSVDAKKVVKSVGLTVSKPKPKQRKDNFDSPMDIEGTIRALPEGMVLWLIVVGKRKERLTYWPFSSVVVKPDKSFSLKYNVRDGGEKELQFYLVGKDGQALMSAFVDINAEHLTPPKVGGHAPLLVLTSDMYKAGPPLHLKFNPVVAETTPAKTQINPSQSAPSPSPAPR